MPQGRTLDVHIGAERMDLLALLVHLYDRLPRDEAAFLQATAIAVQQLQTCFRIVDVAVVDADRSNTGLSYRRDGAPGPTVWRIGTTTKSAVPPRLWLTFLEHIGHDLLGSDVYFADGDRRIALRSPAAYRRWATGNSKAEADEPVWRPTVAEPSPVTFLWPLLDCYRRAFGPVGLYWLLPMMWLVGGLPNDPAALRRVAVSCPNALPRGLAVAPRAVCDDLPAGCRVLYHWWPRGTWRTHAALVMFVMFYQCHVLGGELGSWRREHGPRGDAFFPLEAAVDDLLLVTVGGVPVATAGVQDAKRDDGWYISALCAATRSTAGSLALSHLQSHGRPLVASATGDMFGFYIRHGFAGNETELYMEWFPPKKSARRGA